MKNLFFLSLCLIYSECHAQGGWNNNVFVERFYDVNQKQVLIELSSFSNPHKCNIKNGFHIALDPTQRPTLIKHLIFAYDKKVRIDVYVTGLCVPTHWKNVTYAAFGHIILPSKKE